MNYTINILVKILLNLFTLIRAQKVSFSGNFILAGSLLLNI